MLTAASGRGFLGREQLSGAACAAAALLAEALTTASHASHASHGDATRALHTAVKDNGAVLGLRSSSQNCSSCKRDKYFDTYHRPLMENIKSDYLWVVGF